MVLTAVTLPPAEAHAVVASAPTLTVIANHLIDTRTNTAFVPHGVNVPGLEYSCWQGWRRLPEAGEFAALAAWKINTVRLPLNQNCWLPAPGSPVSAAVTQYRSDVLTWVSGLNAAGLAVILDLHSSAPIGYLAHGQRAMPDSRSTEFWSSVAQTYAGNPSLIFDLFNEPYSRTDAGFTLTWQCWRDGGCQAPVEDDYTATLSGATYTVVGMQALVTAVRATGATQPLMLGGLNYSNDLSGFLANRPTDPLGGIVASWHAYPGQGCHVVSCWNAQVAPVAAVVPIVTGEFGNTAETTSTAAGNAGNYLVPFMSWADAHGVGYLPWAWWDVPASESVPNSVYALFSGSGFTPKSPSGTKFHDYLASLAPPASPAPGTLVRSSAGSTVYLVDGQSSLVPLTSVNDAKDAGIPVLVATVNASVLASYAVRASPLGHALTCAGDYFIAGSGKVWPTTSALVAGLPMTTLEASTCAALPHGAQSISHVLLVRAPSSIWVYSITASGTRTTLGSWQSAIELSAPDPVIVLAVSDSFLTALQVDGGNQHSTKEVRTTGPAGAGGTVQVRPWSGSSTARVAAPTAPTAATAESQPWRHDRHLARGLYARVV